MDEGVGDAEFFDAALGNSWATEQPRTAENPPLVEIAKTAD
jgi:hypothetical protein